MFFVQAWLCCLKIIVFKDILSRLKNIILNSIFYHMRLKSICNTENKTITVMLIRFMNTVSSGIGSMECWDIYREAVYTWNSVRLGNHSSTRVSFANSFPVVLNLVLNGTQTAPIWASTNSISLQNHLCFRQAYIILHARCVWDERT